MHAGNVHAGYAEGSCPLIWLLSLLSKYPKAIARHTISQQPLNLAQLAVCPPTLELAQ